MHIGKSEWIDGYDTTYWEENLASSVGNEWRGDAVSIDCYILNVRDVTLSVIAISILISILSQYFDIVHGCRCCIFGGHTIAASLFTTTTLYHSTV